VVISFLSYTIQYLRLTTEFLFNVANLSLLILNEDNFSQLTGAHELAKYRYSSSIPKIDIACHPVDSPTVNKVVTSQATISLHVLLLPFIAVYTGIHLDR
jgi:hypothetical protein